MHELNQEYLMECGWKRVNGGWLPEDIADGDHEPLDTVSALDLTHFLTMDDQDINLTAMER